MESGVLIRVQGQLWTSAQDAELRRSWLAGDSLKAIAAVFGCSDKCVYQRAARLGLKSRHKVWPPEMTQRFTELWSKGVLVSAIAAELGVSVGAVVGKRDRMGIETRGPGNRNQRTGSASPRWRGGRPPPKRQKPKIEPAPPARSALRKVKPGRLCFLMGYRSV